MDMNDNYYVVSVMAILDEAENDLSPEYFYEVIEDIIQNLKEKITP